MSEPEPAPEARRWLRSAEDYLNIARHLLGGNPPSPGYASWNCPMPEFERRDVIARTSPTPWAADPLAGHGGLKMAVIYTDSEIEALVQSPKRLPAIWRSETQLRPKRGHQERQLTFSGSEGDDFSLILRKSLVNPLDFSVILAVHVPMSNQVFRLRRYNGKSHEHTKPY